MLMPILICELSVLTWEALFFIELAKHERTVADRFLNETEFIPEVRQAFLVSGRYDLIVQAAVKHIEHLRNLAFDALRANRWWLGSRLQSYSTAALEMNCHSLLKLPN